MLSKCETIQSPHVCANNHMRQKHHANCVSILLKSPPHSSRFATDDIMGFYYISLPAGECFMDVSCLCLLPSPCMTAFGC